MASYIDKMTLPDGSTVNIADFRNAGVYYGTCATGASAQQKEVVIKDARNNQFFELHEGNIFFVKFTNNQTFNGVPKIRINSIAETLKSIKRYGTTDAARYEWYAGEVVGFIYDGTNYIIIDGKEATTTYYGITKLYTGAGSSTEAYALTPKGLYAWANAAICPYYSASSTYAVGDKVRYANYLYSCNTTIATAESWDAAHWDQLSPLQHRVSVICPDYCSTSTYTIGDKVIHDNHLYVCSTAITSAEAWNAAHWTQLPSLQEQIDAIDGLPAVTSSDNGKVLRVVNGAWSAAELPSASGVSF